MLSKAHRLRTAKGAGGVLLNPLNGSIEFLDTQSPWFASNSQLIALCLESAISWCIDVSS